MITEAQLAEARLAAEQVARKAVEEFIRRFQVMPKEEKNASTGKPMGS